jgi:hypothetical protein
MVQDEQIIKRKRGQRGLGKEPAMVHISLRIPVETFQFFKQVGVGRPAMRQALEEFVKKHS